MGVFREQYSTCCIWLGFMLLGLSELITGALRLYYEYSDIYCDVPNPTDYCNYELLVSFGFCVSGLIKFLAFLPKCNDMRCWICIMMLLQIAVLVLSIIGIAGHFTVDGFSDMTTREQMKKLSFADLLFVSSVGSHLTLARLLPILHRALQKYQELRRRYSRLISVI